MISRETIADVAAYYGQSPLQVERWTTAQIYEWHSAAIKLEKMAAESYKKKKEKNSG
ncbi:hypothetical protein [Pinibacter soli]|uniref:Uncharacterized protein n=1 Tax=Pinibacter soli TaxID=3044211 RepID=A0ABT6RBQ0_9BACT|nr:hypothetical protein [Pinibacter soli]MDI3319992.1 hypothetical protein [Pinibacter soli]